MRYRHPFGMGNFLVVHVRDARLGGFVTKRLVFPRKVIAAAIKRANGYCEKCGAALKKGRQEVDHILAKGLGGQPVLANAMVLCKPCHTVKTADDVRMMRKADRARDKASGAKKSKRPMGGKKESGRSTATPEKLAGLPPSNLARRIQQ